MRCMYYGHEPDVPTCKDEREELYGALKHETVALRCEVDANPPLVTFHWTFNNSGDLTEVPATRYTSSGEVSRLNYTPVSDMDYGTLACWGSNVISNTTSHHLSLKGVNVTLAVFCFDPWYLIVEIGPILAYSHWQFGLHFEECNDEYQQLKIPFRFSQSSLLIADPFSVG
ncbi:Uncharacterized protein GBIM_08209 [Gryllus bimaculatus]|nr:Uncharacterized protein GBIM_08209 [Gryllus bimaculatus]